MRRSSKQPVQSVTAAPRSLRADLRSREVRYLISMGIRTICFVTAFLTGGYLRWGLVLAAFVLPYVAVVIANAGREPTRQDMVPYVAHGQAQLPRTTRPDDGPTPAEHVAEPRSEEEHGPDEGRAG